MKWFKHFTDSGDDPVIDDSITEFGPLGYYVYFRTMEVVSLAFDASQPGTMVCSLFHFKRKFRCNWKTIRKVLEFYSKRDWIQFRIFEEEGTRKIHIKCPKLIDICDEYTKRVIGKNRDTNPRSDKTISAKEKEAETEKEVDRTTPSDHQPTNHGDKKNSGYTEEFEVFWAAYPRKVGKRKAWSIWKGLKGNRPAADKLIRILETQKCSDQWQKEGGRYIPHPSTWLGQGRWEDELTSVCPSY